MALQPWLRKKLPASAFKVSGVAPAVAAKASAAAVQSAAFRRPAPQQHAAVVLSQTAQGYKKQLPPQPFKAPSPAVSLERGRARSATVQQSIRTGGVARMAPALRAVAEGGLSRVAPGVSAMPRIAPTVVTKKSSLVTQPGGFGRARDTLRGFELAGAPRANTGIRSGITHSARLTLTSEVVSFANMGLSSNCKEGSDCCDNCSGHEAPSGTMWPVHTLPAQETTLPVEQQRAALQRSQRTLAKLQTGVRSRREMQRAPGAQSARTAPPTGGTATTAWFTWHPITLPSAEELFYHWYANLDPYQRNQFDWYVLSTLTEEQLRELRGATLRYYPTFAPGTHPGRGMPVAVRLNTRTHEPA